MNVMEEVRKELRRLDCKETTAKGARKIILLTYQNETKYGIDANVLSVLKKLPDKIGDKFAWNSIIFNPISPDYLVNVLEYLRKRKKRNNMVKTLERMIN